MNWLLVALLIALVFISTRPEKTSKPASIRTAWVWFACIPFTHVVATLFRAGNYRNPHDIALVEIWSDGFQWLFLGLSIMALADVFCWVGRSPQPSPHATGPVPPP